MAALVFGLLMSGMYLYGMVVNVNDLLRGKKKIAMRGARPLDLSRQSNPIAFWVYYGLSIAGTAMAGVFAYHFLREAF